jgi:hypothetical protein
MEPEICLPMRQNGVYECYFCKEGEKRFASDVWLTTYDNKLIAASVCWSHSDEIAVGRLGKDSRIVLWGISEKRVREKLREMLG